MKQDQFFDDLARLATGAVSGLAGMADQVKSDIRRSINRMTDELDLVEGDELARVEKMAQKARQRQIELEERVSDLESRLNELEGN
jgi:hypothetical protein